MNRWILLGLLVLIIPSVNARLFDMDVVTPDVGCSIFGCSFLGDIYMNGYTIYNATFVNASILEHDPVFTAQNSSIWNAINDKYNASNPAGYITAANLTDNWVNISGDTMQGNLNMSDYNITDVNYLFVHNISGRSPIHIMSEVISHDTITADIFYGNIQGTNGSIYGLTITNGTISNMHVIDSAIFNTSLIPETNYTWDLGEPNRVWRNMYVGNLYAANLSSPSIDNLYNITNNINASIKEPSGPYLAYNTTNFWINETALNVTINNISQTRIMTYTMNCTGPNCNVTSSIPIYYQITEVIVTPSTNADYYFELTEYPIITNIIDRNLIKHKGEWHISKSYALNSQIVGNIISGGIEQYTITIKYLQNGVQ